MTTETETEAERMERVPGIIFADGPVDRRARVAGTGIDVFEVIKGFKLMAQDPVRLRAAYHWLTQRQLSAALRYYALYPAEIDARLAEEAAFERGARASGRRIDLD